MTYLEQRDRILQNLRTCSPSSARRLTRPSGAQIEAKCHEQLDLLELNDKVGNTR